MQKDTTTDNNSLELIKEIVSILKTKKCENISVLNLDSVNTFLSYFVIASSNTNLQARSASRDILGFMKKYRKGSRPQSDNDSGWVLLDFEDILVHIMTPESREYYDLEKLWGDANRIIVD